MNITVFLLPVIAVGTKLRAGTTLYSDHHRYDVCRMIGAGDNGLVGEAYMSEKESVVNACTSGNPSAAKIALKCSLPESEEDYFRQYEIMKAFQSQDWCPRVFEIFQHPQGLDCISMELLGPDLVSARNAGGKWSTSAIASIVVAMLDVIESLHKLGYVHQDAHAANWISSGTRGKLKLVDYGYMAKADSDLQLSELQQIVLNGRYLMDLNMDYYQEKNHLYSELCRDVSDQDLCEAFESAFKLKTISPTEMYKSVRSRFQSLVTENPEETSLEAKQKGEVPIDRNHSHGLSPHSWMLLSIIILRI
jgi:serine/threonine protein kinase